MHTVERLEQALRIAQQLGYTVRHEWLGGSGGGDCEIRGQKFLFVDLAVGPDEQLEHVLEVLARDGRFKMLADIECLGNSRNLRKTA